MIINSKEADLNRPIEDFGILQLLAHYQSEEHHNSLCAEYLLNFLCELLNFSKCPQADSFNTLFNNVDVFYVFQLRLPLFISSNSPLKNTAMQLLHQFIKNKPITDEESITIFFSDDAAINNIMPELNEAYNNFIRYHNRQLQNIVGQELGASNYDTTNFRDKLRTSFMYSNMRKVSMSQNDPDEQIPLLDWRQNNNCNKSEQD